MTELVIGKAFDLAVGEVLSESVRRLMVARTMKVRAAILEDVRNANIELSDLMSKDANIAMMIALVEALRQGAAIRNLRIIARILTYKAIRPDETTDDFLSWTEVVKSLTARELWFLITLWKSFKEDPDEPGSDRDNSKTARAKAFSKLVGPGRLLKDAYEYETYGYSLLRTGFVTMISIIADFNLFRPTEKLDRLVEMARLNNWAEGTIEEMELND